MQTTFFSSVLFPGASTGTRPPAISACAPSVRRGLQEAGIYVQGQGGAASPEHFTVSWCPFHVDWRASPRRPQGLAHPGSRGRHPNTPEMEAGSLPSPAGPDACTARSLGMRSGPFPAPASHGAKELFHGLILSGNGARSARGSPPALVKRRVRGRLGWRAGPETAALGMLLLRESKLNSGMGLTTCLEVENDRGGGKWRRRLSLSLLASPGPGPVPGPPGCQQVAGAPAVQGQVLAVELVCAGTQMEFPAWRSGNKSDEEP